MKILISAVGTTDPISNRRDAALLHLARIYRPDKIVLIYSEEMLEKKEKIDVALHSIEGYNPEICIDPNILKNGEVHIFDRMYAEISRIMEPYLKEEDELILNLSSATPQIIAAMFAVNRISDYNVKAIQVATPARAANQRFKPDKEPTIEELIETNLDNQPATFEDRTVEDQSERFNQSLSKRYLRQLIEHYDYAAALAILEQKNTRLLSRKDQAGAINLLKDFSDVFKKQTILSALQAQGFAEGKLKALNYFLMIDILNRRGQVSDVLIKAKSLAEFVLEEKIQSLQPDLIYRDNHLPKLNSSHPDFVNLCSHLDKEMKKERGIESEEVVYNPESVLNLLSFTNILEFYNYEEKLLENIKIVKSFNGERNRIAHGLSEINKNAVSSKRLKELVEALKAILQDSYAFSEQDFKYYDDKNKQLLHLLK